MTRNASSSRIPAGRAGWCSRRGDFFTACVGGVLLATSAAAHADDEWTRRIAQADDVDFRAEAAIPNADGSVLLTGTAPPFVHWLLHVDVEGAVVSQESSAVPARTLDAFDTLRSGDSLVEPPYNFDEFFTPRLAEVCDLERGLAGRFDLRMLTPVLSQGEPRGVHRRNRLDPAGGYVGAVTDLLESSSSVDVAVRVARDCTSQVLYEDADIVGAVADPLSAGGYVLLQTGSTGPSRLSLAHVQGESESVLLRSLEPRLSGSLWMGPALPDGDVVVTELVRESYDRNVFSVLRIEPGLQTSRLLALPYTGLVLAVLASGEETFVVQQVAPRESFQPEPETAIAAFDARGSAKWNVGLQDYRFLGELPSAAPDPVSLWLLRTSGASRVVRPTDTGIEDVGGFVDGEAPMARTASGELVSYVDDTTTGGSSVRWKDLDGTLIRSRTYRVPGRAWVNAVHVDAGDSFVLVTEVGGATRLHALDSAGATRWIGELPPGISLPQGSERIEHFLAASGDRVCVWRMFTYGVGSSIACLAREDGATLFGWLEPQTFSRRAQPMFRIDAEGQVRASVSDCRFVDGDSSCRKRVVTVRVGADGSEVETLVLAEGSSRDVELTLAHSRSGNTLAFAQVAAGTTTLNVLDSNGSALWSRSLAGSIEVIAVGEDGSVLTVRDRVLLADFDASGALRWETGVAFVDASVGPFIGTILDDGDRVVMTSSRSGPRRQFRARIAAADGASRWSHQATGAHQYDPYSETLRISDSGRTVVLNPRQWAVRRQLLAFDVESGRPIEGLTGPDEGVDRARFPQPTASAVHAHVASDGTTALAYDDATLGDVVLHRTSLRAPRSALDARPDAAVLGAWFATDTPGQGLFFARDAGGPLHGGWFTYTADGGHHPSEQRWYSLVEVGSIATGASELAIQRNVDGAFAQGPATTSERVGTAWITRNGCDRLLFQYRFDDHPLSPTTSAIPMQRVTAASRACEAPHAPIVPASEGFDTRSSGVWFDPALPGQGFSLDVRPASGDGPGLISGAWFTYDVPEDVDDPTAQHWFSFAGTLADAQDGTVTVPLFRTIGGSLDGEATNNTWRVGELTFTFTACDAATLTYAFDEVEVAHGFRARSGELALRRLVDCEAAEARLD